MGSPISPSRVEETKNPTKKKYVPPKLEALGSFIDLTQPAVTDVVDGGIDS
jgi:hypothetical protein